MPEPSLSTEHPSPLHRRNQSRLSPEAHPWKPDGYRRLWIDVCGSAARLTGTEQSAIMAGAADPEAPAGLRCDLVTHHRRGHLALAGPLPTPGRFRWLAWGRWRRRFIDAGCCRAQPDPTLRDGLGPCRLPRGHAGLHSFDYHPDLGWPSRLQLHQDQRSWHFVAGDRHETLPARRRH